MRPARALIDLQALRHNYQLARELTGAKALAVIKADAYGHGAVRCARSSSARAGASWFSPVSAPALSSIPRTSWSSRPPLGRTSTSP